MRFHRSSVPLVVVALLTFPQGCKDDPSAETVDAGDHGDAGHTGDGVLSTNGRFEGAFIADPEPPAAGTETIYEVTLRYADTDAPVVGATLTVMPWMQMGMHGHSTSVPPVIEELGDGVYRVTIIYTMAGTWENTFGVTAGALTDEFVLGEDVV